MIRLAAFALLVAAAPAPAATPEERLAAAGLTLPAPPAPLANYVTWRKTGDLLFTSGHGECGPRTIGKLGRDLTVAQGQVAARGTALCLLATVKAAVGDLSRVRRAVRILGFVNSAPDFAEQPKVIDGFSDVLVTAFGEDGKAARSAIGVAALPLGMAVEVEAAFEIAPR